MTDDLDALLDGWALWQEHQPQSADDWLAIAGRCLADPTFDRSKSSLDFRALLGAVETARELARRIAERE